MKKLILFLLILTFFRINVFAQTKTENTIHIEEKVFNWIDKHFVIADTLTNTFLSQLKNSIHWSNPAISFNSYNERQIAFTLKPGIHTNGRTSKRSSSFLLITENRKGEISQGHIVKLTPELLNVEKVNNKVVTKILDAVKTVYSGILTKSSVLNDFIYESEFKKGNHYSHTYITAGKEGLDTCRGRSDSAGCICWYWVRTIIYGKKSGSVTKKFAFKTCPNTQCDQIRVINGIIFRFNCRYLDGGFGSSGVEHLLTDTTLSKKLSR